MSPERGRCHGRFSRWPAAAPSCWSKTSPNVGTRKRESLIWRVTTNSPRFPTGSISATRSSAFSRFRTMTSGCRHCCSSISISSSRSTTPWVTLAATSYYAPSPAGCAKCCARRISWRGSAATNSWCSSRTSHPTTMPRASPGASSIASASATRSTIICKRYNNVLVGPAPRAAIPRTPPAGISADTLLKNADMALYRAKADGRGTFCFFRDEMAQSVEARRILELDLRKGLAHEEFELFYQPLVNLKSGRITTCEALLRWNHPVRGTVSPIDIIPVAEDMGLIVDLGRWILRKACMECMKWPEGVGVAVNFSPQQFHQRDVLSEVRYALEVSGLPAHRLEIEITESSLLRNTQVTHDVLSRLRTIGVRISLDDFGTGYSSLSYLHNFPLQKVKIDRSFLEGIDTDRPLTLLRGVARLSADLGMSVVVEGIETNEQLELISADGTVTEAQGYLFSRPVPAARVRQLLNASHGRRLPGELALPSRSIA